MSFLRNCWYVAAWSDEVPPGGMFARTLLGEPVLLVRDDAGTPSALLDRCPLALRLFHRRDVPPRACPHPPHAFPTLRARQPAMPRQQRDPLRAEPALLNQRCISRRHRRVTPPALGARLVPNGAIALALTNRPLVAAGAMLAAAVPDQLEKWIPFAKHRGLSHWLLLWAAAVATVHFALSHGAAPILGRALPHRVERLTRDAVLGLALGPLLHVVMDGCSRHGVPFGPFVPLRLRLGLYRTAETRRMSLDLSEVIFTAALLALCGVFWRLAWVP